MCGGGPEVDQTPMLRQQDAAAEARAREEARQKRIEAGQSFLDAMFRGGEANTAGLDAESYRLNPDGKLGSAKFGIRMGDSETREFEGYSPYLADFESTLSSFYQPQLDEQYEDAEDQLKYGLARAGQAASSQAAEQYGDLTNTFDIRQNELLSTIDSRVDDRRSAFEATRGALEDMLLQTGDASRVANEATNRVDQLYAEQPDLNPLGDVFANAVSAYGAYGAGRRSGRVAGVYDSPSITERAPQTRSSGTFIS